MKCLLLDHPLKMLRRELKEKKLRRVRKENEQSQVCKSTLDTDKHVI